MARVAVLGSMGMLGSTLTQVLSTKHEVLEINRIGKPAVSSNDLFVLDVTKNPSKLFNILEAHRPKYVFNSIGLIRQRLISGESHELARAVNADFPGFLNQITKELGIHVIQIGTDCVYSGNRGGYSEIDLFDPIDLYGRTKVYGELNSPNAMTIRCSIIGLEKSSAKSLLSWILSQPTNSTILGFANHFWNGVTTLAFSKIVSGIIEDGFFESGVSHLIPCDFVSKLELVKMITETFRRSDICVQPFLTESYINRTLTTNNKGRNDFLWNLGGYQAVPSIQMLVSEFGEFALQKIK